MKQSLTQIGAEFGWSKATAPSDLQRAVRELQGLRSASVQLGASGVAVSLANASADDNIVTAFYHSAPITMANLTGLSLTLLGVVPSNNTASGNTVTIFWLDADGFNYA
jgi:hypothetical protein